MRPLILLIDDDPIAHLINRRIISRCFPEEIILEFLSASQAIAYLGNLSQPKEFRFTIFLDINMPEISGWEFIEILKKQFADLNYRVYLLTSSINENDRERSGTCELVQAFIQKPFSFSKLEQLELHSDIFPSR